MNKEEVIRAIGELFFEKMQLGERPTNGDMIKALFPECKAERTDSGLWVNVQNLDGDSMFSAYWWNSPYRKEQE